MSKSNKEKKWGKADVLISHQMKERCKYLLGNQTIVISFRNSIPPRRAVTTPYLRHLIWLFHQLRIIFSGKIDYISKYDFYGIIAQAANDFTAMNKKQKSKEMLFSVIDASKDFE